MPRVSDMKKRLTDAALDLMWENSYGTTSVDAICERAGAKKGSFYYFFKSKSATGLASRPPSPSDLTDKMPGLQRLLRAESGPDV